MNNNVFVHSLTSSMEPSGMEPSNTESSTARRGNKINIKNFTVNIDFLSYYFNDNG